MNRYTRACGLARRGWGGPTAILALAAVLNTTAMSPAVTVNLHDNLISNWSFDDGAGTNVDDGTGTNDATLTATGTVGWITGKLGGAIQCTPNLTAKTGGGATLPSPLNPDTSALTVAAWVNFSMLPTAMPSTNAYGGILDSAQDSYVLYAPQSTGELRFKVTTNAESASTPVPASVVTTGGANTWHHVAGVYDGQDVKVYWDGQLQSTVTLLLPAIPIKAGQVGAFGYAPTANNAFFPGSVDDAALWGRALDAQEVAYLYNNGTGNAVKAANPTFTIAEPPIPTTPQPIVYLAFQNNLDNAVTGGSGPVAAMLMDEGAGEMTYIDGPIGKAMNLAQTANNPAVGTGTYAKLNYTMTDEGTISFWAKPKSFYNWNEILDNNNTSSAPAEDWEMWVYSDGRARFRIEGDAYVTKTLAAADTWTHFTMTWRKDEGTTNVRVAMYVDGEFLAADSSGTWIAPGTAIGIGGGLTNPAGNVAIDEFRIYDQVLTPDQIREVYAIPEPGAVALLVSGMSLVLLRWRRIRNLGARI